MYGLPSMAVWSTQVVAPRVWPGVWYAVSGTAPILIVSPSPSTRSTFALS
jgi:hypothetical protein